MSTDYNDLAEVQLSAGDDNLGPSAGKAIITGNLAAAGTLITAGPGTNLGIGITVGDGV